MSIPNVAGTTPIAAITTVADARDAGASTATNAPARARPMHEVEIDRVTQQPVPLRFPWLSRLSQQLETASGQRPPFDPAPVLGDHVDRAV